MSKYTELAAALRRTTQEMAVTCSAPLDVWGRHSNTALEAAAALRELEQESERLKELLACAYQLAGTVGAPVRFLDAFSRYEGGIDSLLPVSYDEIEVCAERDRLRETGNWLAAEARENWQEGRLSVDLLTAVEAWERTTLQEGKGDE